MASLKVQTASKGGKLYIRLAYQTASANRKVLNTGFAVPDTQIKGVYKYWDLKTQRAKAAAENSQEINDYLQLQENRFLDYLKECKGRDRCPAIIELTQLFAGDRAKEKAPQILKPVVLTPAPVADNVAAPRKTGLLDLGPIDNLTPALSLYVKFAIEKAGDIKKSTFKPYKTFGEQLQQFEQQRAAGPINLNAVDVKFYKEFTAWLIGTHNNVNSTINRKIKRLKTFLNWGVDEGYINVGTFKKKFVLDQVDASKFPLYDEEKELLYKYIPKAGTESAVYWAFRFALCTGLRYGDICHINPANIKYMDDNGGRLYYLDFVEEKTRERTAVPLSAMALDILKRAKQNTFKNIFDIPTDQEVNRTLKDMGAAIGLDRVCEVKQFQGKELLTEYLPLKDIISFHFARYTYITGLLGSELNPLHVQNNVGHSKLETTLGYNRDIDKKRLKETLLIQNKIA